MLKNVKKLFFPAIVLLSIQPVKGQSVTFSCSGEACGDLNMTTNMQQCLIFTNNSDRYVSIMIRTNSGGQGENISPGATKTIDKFPNGCITLNDYNGMTASYTGKRRKK